MTGFLRGISGLFRGLRDFFARVRTAVHLPGRDEPRAPGVKRRHNIFEAAAVHVAACAEDDDERSAEAAEWVSPEALAFGINELACRAVIALARERSESPQTVARDLLNLPVA
ncbi:hypothetical protein [Streptomyces sp. CB02923]|uniref:hypothetical protein n=1 Tax=Streptomyces sp. CB02923 TaxID=1718985 RepID=UPI001F5B52C3|nr:hypothetical protein [Streptomyces sp. CB02923]